MGDFDGKAIVFTAPSGSGKTTIVQHLLQSYPSLGFSISACTRTPRPGEIDGEDYYFLSKTDFEQKIQSGAFVEYEQVYAGYYYGTLRSEVERLWAMHKHILFDVDVYGALKLKNYFQGKALTIFVKVPSIEILRERLKNRNSETEESLEKRLNKALHEQSFEDKFDAVIVNNHLPAALQEAENIVSRFIN